MKILKKKLTAIISLILAALLLSSCASTGAAALTGGILGGLGELIDGIFGAFTGRDEGVPFSEMEYARPDMDAIEAHVDEAIEALEDNVSYSRISDAITQCINDFYDFQTAYALSDIHSCLDTTDEYWAEEYSFCTESSAVQQQLLDELYYACAASKKAARLERDFFWDGFCEDYADPEDSVYTDEVVALMQREAGLLSEYRTAIAAPVITVDGEELDYYEALSECNDADEYHKLFMEYYYQYNGELADIYIRLIRLRRELAAEMGYDSYRDMQFDYAFSRDYTPEQAERYIEDIRTCAVPVYLSAEPYYYGYDVGEDDVESLVSDAAAAMGGCIDDAFQFLYDNELYDLSYSDLKADMSYTTYIPNYSSPYVFVDPQGSEADILTFCHELGHAVDAWYNYNADESIDLAEVFSQSLEYLMPAYMGESLDSGTVDELYRMKMYDTLECYVQQASFAQFENEVYAMSDDELSAESINAVSLRLAGEYGYLAEGYEDYYAMSWIDIVHFFEYPFYVISYPVSCDVALQIYELELEKSGAGLDKFFALIPRGAVTLVQAAEDAGLESPFAAGRVERAMRDVEARLK